MKALPPGSTIGILGGGQLGRMLSIAAAQLGFDVAIFTDEQDSPAARVSARTTIADYLDHAALTEFTRHVDVVTTEFENVPAETAQALIDAGANVAPNPHALAVAQDRFDEKSYFASAGIATPPFRAIGSQADLDAAIAEIGAPAILKTRRLGYDGRGQIRIKATADARGAYEQLGAPGILEGFCAFEREVSIIAARGHDGAIAFYDLNENEHAGGILSRTTLPARIGAAVTAEAQNAARRVLEAFSYVGVLTIEFFVMPDGQLVANEMAPACTTAVIGPSKARSPRNSSNTSAPSPAGRLARRRASPASRCSTSSAKTPTPGPPSPPIPTRASISTASATPAPAARWVTSRS